MGGMRGVGFSALLGLSDFHKDALASALHVYYLQRKYPHAEMSLSCPRLRPIINNDKINPLDVHEKQLCQIICAYRIFLPLRGDYRVLKGERVLPERDREDCGDEGYLQAYPPGIGIMRSKYSGKDDGTETGDEQFEINDGRSFETMYEDITEEGLQPVLNDYVYV